MKGLIVVIVLVLVALGLYLFDVEKNKEAMKNSDMLGSNGAAVIGSEVAYGAGMKGYYARPSAEAVYPGVVMIHEWWGLNDNIKAMARELAGEGYQVLAVDLFGRVAATPDEARAQTSSLDEAKATENLQAATTYLRAQGSGKIASLGWCFGGKQSLQLALSGEPLDATVIYYGQLETDSTKLATIKWPVLGIFGETDQSIPPSAVNEFQRALSSLGIENDITIYPGVGHAFANPSGDNYAPEETADAWKKVLAFLKTNLQR